jgi:hypothetical protein
VRSASDKKRMRHAAIVAGRGSGVGTVRIHDSGFAIHDSRRRWRCRMATPAHGGARLPMPYNEERCSNH